MQPLQRYSDTVELMVHWFVLYCLLHFTVPRRRRRGAIEMTLVRPCVRYSVRPAVRPKDLVFALLLFLSLDSLEII